MTRVLIAAAAGGLMVLAYPPYGMWWLVVPCVAALLWTARTADRGRQVVVATTGFGAVFFGLLFPWIAELGAIALIPLLATQTSFFLGYGWFLARWRDAPTGRWAVGAVGGWALMEWLRIRVPFGGFGWGLAGLPAGEVAALRPPTAWIGVSGWSVVFVAIAASAVAVAVDRHRSSVMALAVTVGAVAVMVMAAAPQVANGDEVRVAVVQGNSPCPGTHCPDESRLTFASHLDLTRSIEAGTVDLVVWAESVLTLSLDPITNPKVADIIGAEAQRIGATVLAGTDRAVGDDRYIRANIVFAPSGRIVGEYRKTHPVPFGEYIPLRPLFDWIPDLDQVPRDMVRGSGPVRFDTGFGPFGSVVSFESSFSRYPRQAVEAGAHMLVVATTQNSYPYSRASDQLIGITRMHSAALGVDVVHAAVTGRSAIIVNGGDIAARSPLVEPTVLVGTVHMSRREATLYTTLGDWLQSTAVVALAVTALRHRRRRSHPASSRL